MNKPVYIIADHILSPIANGANENFEALCNDLTGIREHNDSKLSPVPVYASLFDGSFKPPNDLVSYTRFEQLLITSVAAALSATTIDSKNPRVGLILSSTKGNISLFEEGQPLTEELREHISLSSSSQKIAKHIGLTSTPMVVSHACISGLVAIITANRLLAEGRYDTVVVTGADIITKFILSGFQSFQAISSAPCKPFDANRTGINLGEGSATIILSTQKPAGEEAIKITGGAISNDANHISGPSRTGEELYQAIQQAMKEAGIDSESIDMISAHGTATRYNDDMESKAIHLAGLDKVPVNSLKGFFGHTLGAAGLIETVIAAHSLRSGKIIPTKGFNTPGTSENINVCSTLQPGLLNACLKTASGFGGCNAAIILEKE